MYDVPWLPFCELAMRHVLNSFLCVSVRAQAKSMSWSVATREVAVRCRHGNQQRSLRERQSPWLGFPRVAGVLLAQFPSVSAI